MVLKKIERQKEVLNQIPMDEATAKAAMTSLPLTRSRPSKVGSIKRAYQNILGFDPKYLFDDDENLVPITKLPQRIRKCITSFKINVAQQIVEYKFEGRLHAADKLAEIEGMTKGEGGSVTVIIKPMQIDKEDGSSS